MKKKMTRMLLALMLAATIQIQPNQAFTITPTTDILATETTENQNDSSEEDNASNTAAPQKQQKIK